MQFVLRSVKILSIQSCRLSRLLLDLVFSPKNVTTVVGTSVFAECRTLATTVRPRTMRGLQNRRYGPSPKIDFVFNLGLFFTKITFKTLTGLWFLGCLVVFKIFLSWASIGPQFVSEFWRFCLCCSRAPETLSWPQFWVTSFRILGFFNSSFE